MNRPLALVAASALSLALSACAARQEAAPEGPPPTLASQDLVLVQDVTTFNLTFTGEVASEDEATIEQANWELVVDGKVVKTGEEKLGVSVPAGGAAPFTVKVDTQYVSSPEELQEMNERGGSMLTALRGKLVVNAGGRDHALDFARAREVRTPRLPSVKLQSRDGARYSEDEANVIFYVGVVNPNPFHMSVNGLEYKASVNGKVLSEGTRGRGDKITPSATDVYEIQFAVREDSYGPEVKALLKTGVLPWVLEGELKGEMFAVPFRLEGQLSLPPPSR